MKFLAALGVICAWWGLAAGEELKWLEPQACYRVELLQKGTPQKLETPAAIVPARWLWPAPAAFGARAYLTDGTPVPLRWERSHRALLLPGCAHDRKVILYSGFSPEHAVHLPTTSALDLEYLSFHEVVYWRHPGNFKRFLEDKKRRLTRQMNHQYQAMLKNLQRQRANRLLFPPRSGKNPVAAYWGINRGYQDHLTYPHRERLWSSQVLRGQEWRLFQSEKLRSFYFDSNLYRSRIFGGVNSYCRQIERQHQAWQKFRNMDRHEAVFGDLLKNFDRRLQNYSAVPRDLDKIEVVSRKLDLHGLSSLRLQGHLVIPRTGEYEFKVDSEAMWHWELAGKVFWQALSAQPERPRCHEFRQKLIGGTWPWKFYFSRCETSGNFAIYWRPAGKNSWHLLEQSNFAPAPEVAVQKITLPDGGEFPVIPRLHRRFFMIDKQDFSALEQLSLPPKVKILYQKRPFPAKSALVALNRWRGNADFALQFHGRKWPFPAADLMRAPVVEPGNLFMKFNLPATRFHDEKLPLQVEVFNEFPQELSAVVTVRVQPLDSNFSPTAEMKSVTLAPQSHQLVTIPGILQGPDAEIKLELLVAGYSFQTLKLRQCRATNLPPVISVSGNLLRRSDRAPICLTVTRRHLSDLREWQLLKLLKIHSIQRVAVIGAGTQWTKSWHQQFPHRHFEFTHWQPAADAVTGGSAWGDWFNWWQNLPAQWTCDAVIWQQGHSERIFWGERDYWRLLGGAIELMRQRFAEIKIFLVLPPQAASHDRQIWQRFAREYGLEIL